MPETEVISWRDLTGNKFVVALHPAMLSEVGYTKNQQIRKTGEPVPTFFKVCYDRRYVLEVIIRKFCKPLFVLGKDELINLIESAWELAYPDVSKAS